MSKFNAPFIAMAALLAACSDETMQTLPAAVPFNISAAHPGAGVDAMGTRAILDGTKSQWEHDDQIAIYPYSYRLSSTSQSTLSIIANSISADYHKASFNGMVTPPAETDTYYAAYPHTAKIAYSASPEDMTVTYIIPFDQAPTQHPKLLLAAKSEENVSYTGLKIKFVAVNAFIRLIVPEEVVSIQMRSLNYQDPLDPNNYAFAPAIAGKLIYSFTENKGNIPDGGAETIHIKNRDIKDFYITVPAITFPWGYLMYLRRNDNRTMTLKIGTNGGRTLVAGRIYKITVPEFIADTPM